MEVLDLGNDEVLGGAVSILRRGRVCHLLRLFVMDLRADER